MHRFTEQVKLAPRRIHIDIYLLYMNIIKQNHFIHFKEQAFPKHSLQKSEKDHGQPILSFLY